MKRWISAAIVALALVVVGHSRAAHACGGGYGGGYLLLAGGVLVAGGADVTFSIVDVAFLASNNPPPRAYGVGEFLLTAPQAALLGLAAVNSFQNGDRDSGTTLLVLSGWTGALAIHGLYTTFRTRSEPPRDPEATPPPTRHAAVDWRVAPALVSAGEARAAPGAVLFGRF